MRYYIIDPEVPGNISSSDFIDKTARPPVIRKLKFEFDGWLGDDLLESICTYIISERLKNEIIGYSGFELEDVDISVSGQFEELYPQKELPTFYWLKVVGEAGTDDFGRTKGNRLVISERVYDVLQKLGTKGADFENY
jgi:hypothetical protein